jgi:hypothetical protein
MGNYWFPDLMDETYEVDLYFVDSTYAIEQRFYWPERFNVKPDMPEVTIRVNDYHTGDPIPDYSLNIDGDIYKTDATGEVSLTGCGESVYSITARFQNYTPVDTTMTVISDTTFVITLVRDSYIKVVDRLTKEPVYRAFVSYGNNTAITNDNGIATIQNLRSENLSFRVEHGDYFSLEDSIDLKSGDTLVIELTRLLANLEFHVIDESGPVVNQLVDLKILNRKTDHNGIALFLNKPARKVYHYSIDRPCYFPVSDSLFLEIDTVIYITLEPDSIPPVLDVGTSGDTLQMSSSSTGDLYVVPPGTERHIDSIRANPLITVPIMMNMPIYVNTTDLQDGEYWVYVIDQCQNVSEELTFGVGIEDLHSGVIEIYPNPAHFLLTVELGNYGDYIVEITSLKGQLLRSDSWEGTTHQLDLSSFQKGIYFITIRSKDFVTTRKIIKL